MLKTYISFAFIYLFIYCQAVVESNINDCKVLCLKKETADVQCQEKCNSTYDGCCSEFPTECGYGCEDEKSSCFNKCPSTNVFSLENCSLSCEYKGQ
ncbi:hypothetical protein BJ944DRAFT_274183 [Cunninghamella echinulata]|nr:hypothetical protein BJ944DRAFT_274183 [Cunninghamella echinulata]